MAAALTGAGDDLADWRPLPIGDDLAALFASIGDLRGALLAATADTAWMPELVADAALPTARVLQAQLVDTVAHGWDVAASIGVPVEFGDPVLAAAYEVARVIPDGPDRDRPGAAFGHALPGGDAATLAGYLALLGRDSSWSAAR